MNTAIALHSTGIDVMASHLDLAAQFEDIYDLYHRKVHSLCFRMLGNQHEAEDVTQDVFLQVHRKLHTFRGDATFSTWLYRLTVNAVLMHIRRQKKWARETPTDDGQIESTERRPDRRRSESLLINRLVLEQAIAQLPPGCRIVFLLHDVEGYEHQEIGRMVGISAGTSKSQLHDARLKLRKILRSNH